MPNLEHVTLFNDFLTGTIPVFNGSPELFWFDVEKNQLSGGLSGILNGSTLRLEYARLNDNQLTGTIPESIGNLSSLTDLFLGRCQLNGTLPTTLGLLTALEELTVNENTMTDNNNNSH